ncbi:hypothetical protein ES708_15225 [subsurface metagenome]
MIPSIGLMIGLYIITRMTSFLTRGGERSESIVVKVFAVITTLVTFLCILDLLRIGIQT